MTFFSITHNIPNLLNCFTFRLASFICAAAQRGPGGIFLNTPVGSKTISFNTYGAGNKMAQKPLNPPSTSERLADQLVKSIARDRGYLGDDIYAKMDPEVRRQVQEAMLAKDKLIGGSVTVYDMTHALKVCKLR